MKIVELTPQDFDIYAKDHELANPWQTSNFGHAAEALGYNTMYLGIEDGMAIKGVALLLTKVVYLGQSVSYSPRGPLLDYEDYKFVEEAIKVFLEEYKLTKRTGRIKEIYQYATALCLTMQLYKDFKKADFSDPAINPYEWYIKMWDSGYDVVDIAEFTGLSWQTIRNILTENKKFLKRNDEESLNELGRYITKWDCDEYGILTDEDWN